MTRGRLRGAGGVGLLVALVAGGALVAYPSEDAEPAPPGRVGIAAAWPDAHCRRRRPRPT